MWQRFSPSSQAAILRSEQLVREWHHKDIAPTHLFLAILDDATPQSQLGILILSAGLKASEARLYVEAMLEPGTVIKSSRRPHLDLDVKRVLEFAFGEAHRVRSALIEPEHIFLACLCPHQNLAVPETLAPLGWDWETLRNKHRELRKRAVQSHENPLEVLTRNGEKVVGAAYNAMRSTWCGRISTGHLLLGVLQDERVIELLGATSVSALALATNARTTIKSDAQLATHDKKLDRGSKRALDRAWQEAQSQGCRFIGPEHILLGLLPRRATLREVLTWGTNVPDAAASVLSSLDEGSLRALINPQAQRNIPEDLPPHFAGAACAAMWLLAMHLPSNLGLARASVQSEGGPNILLFVILLLGAWWMQLASKKPGWKFAWYAATTGFIAGTIVTVLFPR